MEWLTGTAPTRLGRCRHPVPSLSPERPAQMTRRAPEMPGARLISGLPLGKPSRPETASQQPSKAASPDLLMVAHRFPAVLMLHRLAALAVTCATFPASTHKPAARPAPGSHAWIIRQDASAPAGRSRARLRRAALAAVCARASTGGGRHQPKAGGHTWFWFEGRLLTCPH